MDSIVNTDRANGIGATGDECFQDEDIATKDKYRNKGKY